MVHCVFLSPGVGFVDCHFCASPRLELANAKEGKNSVGYHCNCGPTGHEMKEDHQYKALYICDMVLCMKCYNRQKEGMGRIRQRRKWMEHIKIESTDQWYNELDY